MYSWPASFFGSEIKLPIDSVWIAEEETLAWKLFEPHLVSKLVSKNTWSWQPGTRTEQRTYYGYGGRPYTQSVQVPCYEYKPTTQSSYEIVNESSIEAKAKKVKNIKILSGDEIWTIYVNAKVREHENKIVDSLTPFEESTELGIIKDVLTSKENIVIKSQFAIKNWYCEATKTGYSISGPRPFGWGELVGPVVILSLSGFFVSYAINKLT